jgi:hypothetical protein
MEYFAADSEGVTYTPLQVGAHDEGHAAYYVLVFAVLGHFVDPVEVGNATHYPAQRYTRRVTVRCIYADLSISHQLHEVSCGHIWVTARGNVKGG